MRDILGEAIAFAANAHDGQKRKLLNTPYILHPMEVAVIASTMTDDTDTLIAALLHDTVEDTYVTMEDIRAQFGDRVCQLVDSETEDKRANLPPQDTWYVRKIESLKALCGTDDVHIKIIWLADKLSNMRSFYSQYRALGNELWQHLNQKDPKMHLWYYETIADAVACLKNEAAYEEYMDLIRKIFYSSEE